MYANAGGVAPLTSAAAAPTASAAVSHASMLLYSDRNGALGAGGLGGFGAAGIAPGPRRLLEARPSAAADGGRVSADCTGIAPMAAVLRCAVPSYLCMRSPALR